MTESFWEAMPLALLDRTTWKAGKSWLTPSSNGWNAGKTQTTAFQHRDAQPRRVRDATQATAPGA
jgi:hypothetical protein